VAISGDLNAIAFDKSDKKISPAIENNRLSAIREAKKQR
jgi:hypothetical protein